MIIPFGIDSSQLTDSREMSLCLNSVRNCFLQKTSPLGQATDLISLLGSLCWVLCLRMCPVAFGRCLPGSAPVHGHCWAPPNPVSPLWRSDVNGGVLPGTWLFRSPGLPGSLSAALFRVHSSSHSVLWSGCVS